MVTQSTFDVRAEEVAAICREVGVKRLELIGAAATREFDPDRTEPDFLVEFLAEARQPWMGEYSELLERLRDLYGLPVHLTQEGSEWYECHRAWIESTRTPIYEV